MIHKLPSLLQLMKQLQSVPYLASKNLYKVSSYFLHLDKKKLEQFCAALLQAQENIERCSVCFSLKEKKDQCLFCSDKKRDSSVICVVETWQELLSIEKTGGYYGVYHVLGGAISPLDGIGPEDLSITQLIDRVDESVKEIIFAMNQTPEGEATSAFIASKLTSKQIAITRLARGVPVGSSLEYMDKLTVYKALSERRPF